MQILLANAKIMVAPHQLPRGGESVNLTIPQFQSIANELAAEMAQMNIDELARQLDCSRKLAAENWKRYQDFSCAETMPAILAYNGQAYKHLKANTLSSDALGFAQKHLWITCFLYGLLRPMDGIVPYRMKAPLLSPEGEDLIAKATKTKASPRGGWRGLLTDVLIDSVKADDGILIHLSTEEYEHLFDWKRVMEEVKVIHPLFYVRDNKTPLAFRAFADVRNAGAGGEAGSLKMQAVWAKSCRGAMVRYILENGITSPDELKAFSYEGFEYSPNHTFPSTCSGQAKLSTSSEETFPHFIRN